MADRGAAIRVGRWLAVDILCWLSVALVFAMQGYILSAWRGVPQAWWASFGYALAIFSVWAVLTPVIIVGLLHAETILARGWQVAAVFVAGLPIAAVSHVAIFALLYWPVFSGDGAIPSRLAMVERMALQNLDTNALFYVIIAGGTLAWAAHLRRRTPVPTIPESLARQGGHPQRLHVRSAGRVQLVSLTEVDWIGAADDYAEIHAGGTVHLVERSLAALQRELPAREFARIHRSALVRLDRIAELKSLGRGDASVHLTDGTELRLSRRYRANLAALIRPAVETDPA